MVLMRMMTAGFYRPGSVDVSAPANTIFKSTEIVKQMGVAAFSTVDMYIKCSLDTSTYTVANSLTVDDSSCGAAGAAGDGWLSSELVKAGTIANEQFGAATSVSDDGSIVAVAQKQYSSNEREAVCQPELSGGSATSPIKSVTRPVGANGPPRAW